MNNIHLELEYEGDTMHDALGISVCEWRGFFNQLEEARFNGKIGTARYERRFTKHNAGSKIVLEIKPPESLNMFAYRPEATDLLNALYLHPYRIGGRKHPQRDLVIWFSYQHVIRLVPGGSLTPPSVVYTVAKHDTSSEVLDVLGTVLNVKPYLDAIDLMADLATLGPDREKAVFDFFAGLPTATLDHFVKDGHSVVPYMGRYTRELLSVAQQINPLAKGIYIKNGSAVAYEAKINGVYVDMLSDYLCYYHDDYYYYGKDTGFAPTKY